MRLPNTSLAGLSTTIFETMSRLSEASGAINLGQGFPDEGGPASVIEEARRWLASESNQYPPMAGLLALREAIAAHELSRYGLPRDPATEVVVTSGATEALGAALLALVAPGDAVLVIEPLYDSYVPMIRRAGGRPVALRLAPPGFALDLAALEEVARRESVRTILLNNPQNPAAKVFTRAELEGLARVAASLDAWIIADEVYEHIVFDGASHVPIATLADARDRTLKIGSAGKIFSMTGWKVGWVTGPAHLVASVARAHQYLTFTTPPNLQAAVALGLRQEGAWIDALTTTLAQKRDRLAAGLRAAGLAPLPAAGTYFLNVSIAGTPWEGRDTDYARDLTQRRKVAAIPLSSFYLDEPARDLVRFCFAKREPILDEAVRRLAADA